MPRIPGLAFGSAFALLALGPARTASALDPARAIGQYGRDAWTTVQGLPQASVLAIAQTTDGYLWLGTNAGLARFDGASFAVFDPSNARGLQGRRIQSLLGADDGSLWIGTDGKGVTLYRKGRFEALAGQGLAGASGNALYADETGALWIATWSGVARVANGRVSWLRRKDGLPHDSVFALAGDRRGRVIAAAGLGLAEIRAGAVTPFRPDLGILEPQSLLVDRRGVVWVGSASGLDRIEGTHRRRLTTRDGLLANFVTALLEDRDGNVWIGSEGGLNRWRDGRIDGLSASDGLPGSAVSSLFEDREGNLWVGLRGAGLVRFRDGELTTYTSREGLADDNVTCVLQSRDGSLWFGTTRGLTRWHGGRFTTYTRRDGLLNDSITGLGEDPERGLVIGTFAKRLNVFRDGRIGVLPGLTIASTIPSAIRRDRAGALWIGTAGAGLYRLSAGHVEHFPFDASAGRHVSYGVLEDSRGVLWFATPNGLLRYAEGRFSVVEVAREGDNLGVTYALHEDGDGSLWIATRDNGLCRLRPGRPARCYGRAQGLLDDTVYQVLEDDAGRLFFGTPRGIGVVARRDVDAFDAGRLRRLPGLALGVQDGMATPECQGQRSPAGWKASDGRLWFPTVRGAVVVDPRRVGALPAPPPVTIVAIAVDGTAFPPETGVSAPPGRGDVEIRYAGLSLRAPESQRFRYRLDGFDAGWVEAGPRHTARYTAVSHGSYRFRVTAAQGAGPWNAHEASIDLRIAPRFYQTRLWAAAVSLALAALAWSAYRWRVRALHSRTVELSLKVGEALANVKVLRGLLPICSHCKRVRSDQGYWQQIEAYIRDHSEASFTHGVCPECLKKFFPEHATKVLDRIRGGSDPSGTP